jgi:FtsH-binding integral membrane protein
MLQTIISGLILAAVSGLAFLAYKHPKEYKKLSTILIWATFGIIMLFDVFMCGYITGVFCGSIEDNHSSWMIWVAVIGAITVVFLKCLTLLGLLAKADRKDDADKDEPPKSKAP